MKEIPTVRCLNGAVLGAILFLFVATGMSAPEPETASEVEKTMEQLPATAGTPEVEQRKEQLPNAPTGDVAETKADSAEDPGTDTATADQNISPRMKAHDRFLFLHDEGRFREASIVGLEVVEITRQEFGSDHIKMVSPLVNLAIVQTKDGDFQAAEANYKASILIIEKQEGILSPRLINSLSGLGSTYNRAGQYDQGIITLERALLINHVNEGLYNFEQFKIQDGLTDSYSGMNALEDATFYQKAQVEIYQRKMGVDHPDVSKALYKLARWYELVNNTEEAMLAYRKADRLLREAGGDANVARVEALQGLAHVYERQAQPSATANTLKKALEIVDAQPEPDLLQRATILVALGDLYTRQAKVETSQMNYLEAWDNLSQDDEYLDQRDEFFSEPVRVSGGSFSKIEFNSRGKPDDNLKDGFVLVSYTVTEKGRAKDIKVIESEPPGLMDGSIVSTYKRSYYRARRVEGDAVASNDIAARHDFKYFKSSGDKADDSNKKGSADSSAGSERLEYPEMND